MTRLAEIQARWAKATKAPWRANGGARKAFVFGTPPESEVCTCWGGNNSDEQSALDDALAIAAAPSDIAWLVERVWDLEAGLGDALDAWTDRVPGTYNRLRALLAKGK